MIDSHIIKQKPNNDECYTPRYGVEPLLEFMEPFRNKIIWCPFDTEESEFVKVFREYGYNVVQSHISEGKDYFSYEPENWDVMISNPPFSGKKRIFERAVSFNKPFCLLMTIAWLNDSAPAKVFQNIDLQLLMFKKRMQFKRTGAESEVITNSNDVDSFNARSKKQKEQTDKINFSSAYFCREFLPKQIIFTDFQPYGQQNLFEEDN